MAQTTGYTCDVCHSFTTGTKAVNGSFGPPAGWLGVKVRTDREVKEGEQASANNVLDVCSNLCLANLGAERYEAETGEHYAKIAKRAYDREWRRENNKKKREVG